MAISLMAKMKDKLNQKSHIKELTKNAANEVFADDADYKGIIKRDDQLGKACISLFSIFGGSVVLFFLGCWTGYAEWLADKGSELIDEAGDDAYVINEERKKRKQEKAYKKELEGYSEEIEGQSQEKN